MFARVVSKVTVGQLSQHYYDENIANLAFSVPGNIISYAIDYISFYCISQNRIYILSLRHFKSVQNVYTMQCSNVKVLEVRFFLNS